MRNQGQPPVHPFIKWVGGKRSILPELRERAPDRYIGYHEPFLGGGALFFSESPTKAHLSDTNERLIQTYGALKDSVAEVIAELEQHEMFHSADYYLSCRGRINRDPSPVETAGLFIYLNKTCFNGLYRVNRANGFNVPMGKYTNPKILDETNLLAVSRRLKKASLSVKSFETVEAYRGDFYYFDPPYHGTFASYSKDGFDDEQHAKLSRKCREIDEAGGRFMLSNSDTDYIRELYKGFYIEDVMASRNVSCKPGQRGRKSEFIIRNYG